MLQLKNELTAFLIEYCRQKRLSLRALSINAGLSPGTVHNIIHRKYRPSVYSLNRLADYLGVEREYMWQIAGFINNTGDSPSDDCVDRRLESYSIRFNNLTQSGRDTVINVIGSLIDFLEQGDPTSYQSEVQ